MKPVTQGDLVACFFAAVFLGAALAMVALCDFNPENTPHKLVKRIEALEQLTKTPTTKTK